MTDKEGLDRVKTELQKVVKLLEKEDAKLKGKGPTATGTATEPNLEKRQIKPRSEVQ